MIEPSLLDYLVAKLRFWRASPEELPSLRRLWSEEARAEAASHVPKGPMPTVKPSPGRRPFWRWRIGRGEGPPPIAVVSALVLALTGQAMFALERPAVAAGLVLLAGAAGAVIFAVRRGEVALPTPPGPIAEMAVWRRPNVAVAGGAGAAAAIAASAASDNQLSVPGLTAWLVAVGLALVAIAPAGIISRWRTRLADIATRDRWRLELDRSALLPILLVATAVLLRTRDLASVPAEMVSAHAELLLAMVRSAAANPPIIFPWGPGGLEPIPVYLGALLAPAAGGLSFAALKLGTVLAGLVTLPLVYLVGREVGGRGVALAALALTAVGSWPDLVSRTGLADAWLPPFAAAALLLLLRAIRTGRPVTFAGAGLAIGLAIQTTSLARSLPVAAAIVVAVAIATAAGMRRRRLALGLVAVLVFAGLGGLPTLVAGVAKAGNVPTGWWFGAAEGVSNQHATTGLVERFGRVLAQPLWSDGPSWLHGGTERPGVDRVTGAMLVLGIAVATVAAVRRRSPAGGLVLVAVPILLMPAWLAALDPGLAPSPLRCAAAVAPVFVLAGVGLAAVWEAVSSSLSAPLGGRVATAIAVVLVALSALAGRAVIEGPFAERWNRSAWNASELGAAVRAGIALGVAPERARVVPYPHWVDTRLVAAEAGFPGGDLAIDLESLATAQERGGPRLFVLHPGDRQNLQRLRSWYPRATIIQYRSRIEGQAFTIVIDLSGASGG